MDTNGEDLVASGESCGLSDVSDCGECTADIAVRDMASSFQIQMSESTEKFPCDTESVIGSDAQSKDVGHMGPQDVQLQKAELILQIQYLMMFITNKLHEHQLMDKLDSKPPSQ